MMVFITISQISLILASWPRKLWLALKTLLCKTSKVEAKYCTWLFILAFDFTPVQISNTLRNCPFKAVPRSRRGTPTILETCFGNVLKSMLPSKELISFNEPKCRERLTEFFNFFRNYPVSSSTKLWYWEIISTTKHHQSMQTLLMRSYLVQIIIISLMVRLPGDGATSKEMVTGRWRP